MAKAKVNDPFVAAYPVVAQWVRDGGWIELGSDESSASFIRAVDEGGVAWEGKTSYPTFDDAFRDANAGIAELLDERIPEPAAKPKKASAAKNRKPATPKLVAVDSSMLTAVGYDATKKELIAVFRSGAQWRYRGVSQKTYRELLASDSKGSYMRSQIIGMYPEYQTRR